MKDGACPMGLKGQVDRSSVHLLRICLRFEYRAAIVGELRRILPQARDDPIGVRYVFAAKPENIGRAGKLLFKGSAILLRKSRVLKADAAGDRHSKTQDNVVHSHIRSFFRIQEAAGSARGVRLENKCGHGRFTAYNKM